MTTREIIAAFEKGARANREDKCRYGNLIKFSSPGEVIMTGDLHGNEKNFSKLRKYADLGNNPERHLILHEMLHCSQNQSANQCHSYQLLAQVAQLKAEFPHQLHILMGNHAMAQVTKDEILKGGQPMVRALNNAISSTFNENRALVTHALDEFIMSFPIAARSENRIWMSHSLPSMRHLVHFKNSDIFEKKLILEDIKSNPALRALTWDRSHSEKCLDELRTMWEVDYFIGGHQPQSEGCCCNHQRMIILASDHPHGCFLPFNLQNNYLPNELFSLIRPLASIE